MSGNGRFLKADGVVLLRLVAVTVAAIVAMSFALSFTSQHALAVAANIPTTIAIGWPLIVDGTIVVSTFAVLVLEGRGRRGPTAYAWTILVLFGLVSIYANGVHATGRHLTLPEDFAIGAVPALALLLSTHLLVIMLKSPHAQVAAVAAADQSVERAADAPAPVAVTAAPAVAARVASPEPYVDIAPDEEQTAPLPAHAKAAMTAAPTTVGPRSSASTTRTTTVDRDQVARRIRSHIAKHGKHPSGAVVGDWIGQTPRSGRRLVVTLAEEGKIPAEPATAATAGA